MIYSNICITHQPPLTRILITCKTYNTAILDDVFTKMKEGAQVHSKSLLELLAACRRRVLMLKREISGEMDDLSQRSLSLEEDHNDTLDNYNSSLKEYSKQFQKLERRFATTGTNVIRIGERLTSIDAQKKYASDAKSLLIYFKAFNLPLLDDGTEPPLPSFFTESRTANEAVEVLSQLMAISAELKGPQFARAVNRIQLTANEMEKGLLSKFHWALDKGLLSRLKKSAYTLSSFNGGTNLMKEYVQRVFANVQAQANFGELSMDRRSAVENVEGHIVSKLNQWRSLWSKEHETIVSIFPPGTAIKVLRMILERLYTDSALGIDHLLTTSLQSPTLTTTEMLSILGFTYVNVKLFDKEIVEITNREITLPDDEGVRHIPIDLRFVSVLSDQVFNSHQAKYLDTEIVLLNSVLKSNIDELISPALRIQIDYLMDDHHHENVRINTKDFVKPSELVDVLLGEVFQLEYVMNMLQASQEAVGRCLKLGAGPTCEKTANRVVAIYKTVVGQLCEAYMEPALQLCTIFTREYHSDHAPPPSFFRIVQTVVGITHCIHSHFVQVVTPALNNCPNELTKGQSLHRGFLQTIETATLSGISSRLNAVVSHAQWMISNLHKKTDYGAKEDVHLDKPTPACQSLCTLISMEAEIAYQSLDGQNRNSCCDMLGISIVDLIINHVRAIKKFSDLGALLLKLDMDFYKETFKKLKSPVTDAAMDEAHKLSLLLLVPADTLQEYTQEALSSVETGLVLDFIKLRPDAKSREVKAFLTKHLGSKGIKEAD
jgi:hypothetical protein